MFRIIFKNYSWIHKAPLTKKLLHIQHAYFGNANSNKLSLFHPPKEIISTHNKAHLPSQGDVKENFIDFKTFFSSPALHENDIKSFDVLYKTRKNIKVTGKSKKKIVTSFYNYDVYEILELKLSTDYEKILYFLRVRGDMIRDVEILYILESFSKENLLQKFYDDEPLLYTSLFNQAETVIYRSVDTTIRMLRVLEKEDMFYPNVIRQVYKNYLMRLNDQDSSIEPDEILEGLSFLKGEEIYGIVEVEVTLEALTTLFFSANFLFPKVFEYLNIMNDIGHVNHAKFQVMLQEYLVECVPYITIQEFIEVFYILVKNQIDESVIYYHVEDILRRKFKGILRPSQEASEGFILFEQFGKLIWAISQVQSVTENEKLWDKLEDITLTFIEKELEEGGHLEKKDISIILQSFNKANRGSHVFWSFKFEDIVLHEKGTSPYEYSDLVILLYNRIKRQIYYPEFFENILGFEKELKMSYLYGLEINQFHLTTYVYSVGLDLYSDYLKEATDLEEKSLKQNSLDEFLSLASVRISDYLESIHSKDLELLDIQQFFDMYICLIKLVDKELIKLSDSAMETLNLRMNSQFSKTTFADLMKLAITICDFEPEESRWTQV